MLLYRPRQLLFPSEGKGLLRGLSTSIKKTGEGRWKKTNKNENKIRFKSVDA